MQNKCKMATCMDRIKTQQKLLTKYNKERKGLKSILQEIDNLTEPEENQSLYLIRVGGVKRRVKKALRILDE